MIPMCFQVIGRDRLPGMKDKGSLPFTEAAILEIQRLGNIGEFRMMPRRAYTHLTIIEVAMYVCMYVCIVYRVF